MGVLERAVKDSPDGGALLCAAVDKDGMTLLHSAASGGQLPVMEFLVSNGVSVSAKDSRGGTAMLEAAAAGHVKAAQWLLDRGVEGGVLGKDSRGDAMVHLAAGLGHEKVEK